MLAQRPRCQIATIARSSAACVAGTSRNPLPVAVPGPDSALPPDTSNPTSKCQGVAPSALRLSLAIALASAPSTPCCAAGPTSPGHHPRRRSQYHASHAGTLKYHRVERDRNRAEQPRHRLRRHSHGGGAESNPCHPCGPPVAEPPQPPAPERKRQAARRDREQRHRHHGCRRKPHAGLSRHPGIRAEPDDGLDDDPRRQLQQRQRPEPPPSLPCRSRHASSQSDAVPLRAIALVRAMSVRGQPVENDGRASRECSRLPKSADKWCRSGLDVICEGRPGTHMTDIDGAWQSIRARAGLRDVRIHDIRHPFASRAVTLGESRLVLGNPPRIPPHQPPIHWTMTPESAFPTPPPPNRNRRPPTA